MMQFCVKTATYRQSSMLNICDADLIGRDVRKDELQVSISRSYYGDRTVDAAEAETLLQNSSIINMAGRQTVSLSIRLGIGSSEGVKNIGGIPFLIVFKM